MNGSSFTTNTILRDPFLIKHLNENQFRDNLHKGFLQFAFLIKRVYGPFTPEPESESEEEEEPPPKPKMKRLSKVWVSTSSKRSSRSSQVLKDPHWKTMLMKYKGADNKGKKDKTKQTKTPKKPSKASVKLPTIKKSKGEDGDSLGVDKQRVRYMFRYSQSLDLFKQQKYEELLREMGVDPKSVDITKIDFTDIDDPALVEVNLEWCRVGTFVEDSRSAASFQTQYDDITEADRFSVLFGQSRAPSRKSVISLVSERGRETPGRQSMVMGNIPRLPPIGEH